MIDFHIQDLMVIGFLVFLEGVLSIDNALVLALLAKPLPPEQQKKALTYGLIGAVVFRFIAIGLAAFLMKWVWVKFVGGGYLIWVALAHFFSKSKPETSKKEMKSTSFWKTVLVIELTDIAFAVDSILAAVALTNKFWIIFAGGVIGLVLMRFAAGYFIRLLDRFPKFETSAYLLVFLIGLKLVVDGFHLPGLDFHSTSSPAFWTFWILMLSVILFGFKSTQKTD